jgi:hypothetical protein
MPRFVLLYHRCPPEYKRASHWDLMLESGDVLRTWALGELPRGWCGAHSRTVAVDESCTELAPADSVAAELLGDHRRDYLQIEGPLSGNRGSVVRVDEGTYRTECQQANSWRVTLMGEHSSGAITLKRTAVDSSKWSLECEPTS